MSTTCKGSTNLRLTVKVDWTIKIYFMQSNDWRAEFILSGKKANWYSKNS